jgi:hypothetical protein
MMTYKEARNSTSYDRFMDKVRKTKSCWHWTGARNQWDYGIFTVKRPGALRRGNCAAHRWMYEHVHRRRLPRVMQVLHMCENPFCVNPAHLKAGTRSQNHQMGRPPRGSSKYRGVSFQKARGTWRAQIMKNKKKENLGDFTIEKEAARAYDRAARKKFKYPKLNFPNE